MLGKAKRKGHKCTILRSFPFTLILIPIATFFPFQTRSLLPLLPPPPPMLYFSYSSSHLRTILTHTLYFVVFSLKKVPRKKCKKEKKAIKILTVGRVPTAPPHHILSFSPAFTCSKVCNTKIHYFQTGIYADHDDVDDYERLNSFSFSLVLLCRVFFLVSVLLFSAFSKYFLFI